MGWMDFGKKRSFLYEQELKEIESTLVKNGIEPKFGPANEYNLSYLDEMNVPDSVCQFYEEAEPKYTIDINGARIDSISELRLENEKAIPGYVITPRGYFVIGTTLYGDAYCIDLNSLDSDGQPTVVLVSHDLVNETADDEEIKSGIIKIADNFKEFLSKFAKGDLPIQYWDLKE